MRLDDGSSGSATYCEDQRQGFAKVVKTGKVLRTTPSKDDFFLNTVRLSKEQGVWKVARATWAKGEAYAYETEQAGDCR